MGGRASLRLVVLCQVTSSGSVLTHHHVFVSLFGLNTPAVVADVTVLSHSCTSINGSLFQARGKKSSAAGTCNVIGSLLGVGNSHVEHHVESYPFFPVLSAHTMCSHTHLVHGSKCLSVLRRLALIAICCHC